MKLPNVFALCYFIRCVCAYLFGTLTRSRFHYSSSLVFGWGTELSMRVASETIGSHRYTPTTAVLHIERVRCGTDTRSIEQVRSRFLSFFCSSPRDRKEALPGLFGGWRACFVFRYFFFLFLVFCLIFFRFLLFGVFRRLQLLQGGTTAKLQTPRICFVQIWSW